MYNLKLILIPYTVLIPMPYYLITYLLLCYTMYFFHRSLRRSKTTSQELETNEKRSGL